MSPPKMVRFLLPAKVYGGSTPRQKVPPVGQARHCQFRCPTCEAIFSHYILLCIHTWSHAPEDMSIPSPALKPCSILQSTENFGLQCFLCPLRFGSHVGLRQHLDNQHTEADDISRLRFACAFCAMRYASADLLIAHIQQHAVWEDGDFYPIFIGIISNPKPGTKRSLYSSPQKDEAAASSSKCGLGPQLPNYLLLNETMPRSFEFDELIRELQKIAGESPTTDTLARKSTLSDRCRAKGSQSVLRYLCALCGMKFQHGYQIDEHVRLRHQGFLKLMKARHACVYCGTKFFKLSVLREHLLKHHAVAVTPQKAVVRF
ncbi:unnamed protein product [Ixodes hexagonus]